MGKASKNKKDKVPRITEEEYAKYISSLKFSGGVAKDELKEQSLIKLSDSATCEDKKLL